MAQISQIPPKNAINSRAITLIFRRNLEYYAHFAIAILSCKGLILTIFKATPLL